MSWLKGDHHAPTRGSLTACNTTSTTMAYEDYSEDFNSVMPYHVMIYDVKEKGLCELLM
jgi:hypothetical protein